MPSLSYRQVRKILRKQGFIFVREGKGSHEIWKHKTEERLPITIPFSRKDYKTGTANATAKDLGFKNLNELKEAPF